MKESPLIWPDIRTDIKKENVLEESLHIASDTRTVIKEDFNIDESGISTIIKEEFIVDGSDSAPKDVHTGMREEIFLNETDHDQFMDEQSGWPTSY